MREQEEQRTAHNGAKVPPNRAMQFSQSFELEAGLSVPSGDKKHRFWVQDARRIDVRYNTEMYYVAFAESTTIAADNAMKMALARTLPLRLYHPSLSA